MTNRVEAGLPNIVGYLGNSFEHGTFNQTSGVFDREGSSLKSSADGGGPFNGLSKLANFNAVRSSSVYGKSSTVTPKSQKTNFAIHY